MLLLCKKIYVQNSSHCFPGFIFCCYSHINERNIYPIRLATNSYEKNGSIHIWANWNNLDKFQQFQSNLGAIEKLKLNLGKLK